MEIKKTAWLTGKDGEQFSVNLTLVSSTSKKPELVNSSLFYQSHLYDCQEGHSTTYFAVMAICGGKVYAYSIVPVGLEEWPEVQSLLSQGEDMEDIKKMSFQDIDLYSSSIK